MSSRRTVILWSVLLVLLTGYISHRAMQYHAVRSYPPGIRTPPPLAGKNSISGLEVTQGPTGLWTVDFDYFYTGQPAFAELSCIRIRTPMRPMACLEPWTSTPSSALRSAANTT